MEFWYRANGIIHPDTWHKLEFMQSWNWNVEHYVYDDDATVTGGTEDVLQRELLLSNPVECDKFKMVILNAPGTEVNFRSRNFSRRVGV